MYISLTWPDRFYKVTNLQSLFLVWMLFCKLFKPFLIIEISSLENGVLGNTLLRVPETDDEIFKTCKDIMMILVFQKADQVFCLKTGYREEIKCLKGKQKGNIYKRRL